jgi:hypothetical protein
MAFDEMMVPGTNVVVVFFFPSYFRSLALPFQLSNYAKNGRPAWQ